MQTRRMIVIVVFAAAAGLACAERGSAPLQAPSPKGEPARTLAAGKPQVTLLFGGDASVARGVADMMKGEGKDDAAYPFALVKSAFDAADLTFLNVECVLSDSEASEAKKKWRIRAPTKNAEAFKTLGVDVVSVANNHALDFGEQGFASTLKTFAALDVLTVGTQWKAAQRQDPLVVQVGATKVGFLAYNAHGDEHRDVDYRPRSMTYKRKDALADIRKARAMVDVLVVSMHWGWELSYAPWSWQRDDAHALVDAGVDLVIGHHPHVPQPVEEYKGALIAYSLGDFIFDKSSPWLVHRTNPRFLLQAVYAGKQRVSWELVPMRPEGRFRPVVDATADTQSWIERPTDPPKLARLADRLPDAKVERVVAGVVAPCTLDKKAPPQENNWLRWLAPRFACTTEVKAPWTTVAPSAETSGLVYRRGIWAPPHGEGLLRMTFPPAPLGAKLEGFAGVPDWWVKRAAGAPPIIVRVTVDGAPPLELEVPHEAGWRSFVVDTSAIAGQSKAVVVEISGGNTAPRGEDVLLFDAWVPGPAAS